jgi:hypothetical protein
MAILAGDRYNRGWNMVPKVPKSGYTPAVGDLVVVDTSLANGVDLIASTEAPYGIVEVVGADGVLTVAELVPGTYTELPTASDPSLGNHVKFSSNTRPASTSVQRTVVVGHASDGGGTVVAIGTDCPHGAGHCVVRWS